MSLITNFEKYYVVPAAAFHASPTADDFITKAKEFICDVDKGLYKFKFNKTDWRNINNTLDHLKSTTKYANKEFCKAVCIEEFIKALNRTKFNRQYRSYRVIFSATETFNYIMLLDKRFPKVHSSNYTMISNIDYFANHYRKMNGNNEFHGMLFTRPRPTSISAIYKGRSYTFEYDDHGFLENARVVHTDIYDYIVKILSAYSTFSTQMFDSKKTRLARMNRELITAQQRVEYIKDQIKELEKS